jgi:hypothetical protein
VLVDDCNGAVWEEVAAETPPSSQALSTSNAIAPHAIANVSRAGRRSITAG